MQWLVDVLVACAHQVLRRNGLWQPNWIELTHLQLSALKHSWFSLLANGTHLWLYWPKRALVVWLSNCCWRIRACHVRGSHWALVYCLERKSSRCTSRSLLLKALCELLKVFFELVVLFLVVLQTLLIRLIALVSILKGRRSHWVSHGAIGVFFVKCGSCIWIGCIVVCSSDGSALVAKATLASLATLTVTMPPVLSVRLLQLFALLFNHIVRWASTESGALV